MKTLEDRYKIDPVKACQLALRRTAGIDSHETRMQRINKLLGMDGVEAVRGEWQNGYWCDIVATYCNSGDSYNITIICQRGDCRFYAPLFFVSAISDFVARQGDKLGIL